MEIFLSKFDNINEGNENDDFNSTYLNKMLIDNQATDVNKDKFKAQLPLEHIFGFCKLFKKVIKNLGFEITFKTANLQNIIYNSIADGTQINVTINSLYLYVPFLIPTTETELMFNESIQNNYRVFFDDWYTERRIAADEMYQVNIGSAQSVNSLKYLICAHQTADRSDIPKKRTNISIFDHLDARNYFIEIDGVRYPRDGVLANYSLNEYLNQYRDVKIFYKEYVGEKLLNPFITYPFMKDKYPVHVIDLRFQVDHKTPQKIQSFEDYRAAPANAKLFIRLIRRREIEMISDGNKLIEVKVI